VDCCNFDHLNAIEYGGGRYVAVDAFGSMPKSCD
jgi:hypothetical protein